MIFASYFDKQTYELVRSSGLDPSRRSWRSLEPGTNSLIGYGDKKMARKDAFAVSSKNASGCPFIAVDLSFDSKVVWP